MRAALKGTEQKPPAFVLHFRPQRASSRASRSGGLGRPQCGGPGATHGSDGRAAGGAGSGREIGFLGYTFVLTALVMYMFCLFVKI